MIAKNCDGKVPTPGEFTDEDKALLKEVRESLIAAMRKEFDKFSFNRGLEHFCRVVNAANAYIDVQAPWALKKTDVKRMETVLYVLAETIRCLAIAIQPVVPQSASKMLDQIVVPLDKRQYRHISSSEALQPGIELPAPEGVFPRIQIEEKAA
jgi:methionyl-tRNA synthetase